MPSERPERRLRDIISAIDEIDEYLQGVSSLAAFEQDGRTRRAVERCLEIVCEAARCLGPEVELVMPDQPWAQIRGMGNRMRHEYDAISTVVVWGVVRHDLPPLRATCAAALERLGR